MFKLTSNIIQNAIDHNKLSHAYLFYGDKGTDIEKHILIAIKTIMQNAKTEQKWYLNISKLSQ